MKFTKKVLDSMERCYAASSLVVDGKTYAVLASEAIDGPCFAYTGDDFSTKETIWEKAGGTMSFVQIPGTNGEFIAVQRFFPGFQSAEAKLVWGKRKSGGTWSVEDLAALPFVHRFDLFTVEDEVWVLAAVLCAEKKDREDWSSPGTVYVGKLPKNAREGISFSPILEGQFKNHGYGRGIWKGRTAGFVTSAVGLYAVVPPAKKGEKWVTEQLLSRPIGDVAVIDIDGDGIDELITIEPFHGDQFVVNKKNAAGIWDAVYRYPGEIDFAHAVVAASLRGKPAVIGGIRRKRAELFVLQYENGDYKVTELESGGGPSNAVVINQKDRDIIISANHTKNEAALFYVTD